MDEAGTGTVLWMTDVVKSFGGNRALCGVSLGINRGEIHALIGGNGSGKSTLLKILAGVLPADSGSLKVQDRAWNLRDFTPEAARESGLRFVHQQPTVFPSLSILDNLCINGQYSIGLMGNIRWGSTRRRVLDTMERFGIDASPNQLVGQLSPAMRTMVEIARALQGQEPGSQSVLALDEPTAALPSREVEMLLGMLQRFASQDSQAILFVTHRLEEIVQVADRVTVLRDGMDVATLNREGLSKAVLAEAIVGRPLEAFFPEPVAQHPASRPVLELDCVNGGGVRDLSIAVEAGEVLGIAGHMGSGRSTVLKLIYGATTVESGRVCLDGRELALHDPEDAIQAGIGYVPEDRLGHAVLPTMSIADNLAMVSPRDYWKGGRHQRKQEFADAAAAIKTYGIKADSPSVPMNSLSGGNQQKVVMARWLRRGPRVLLLDEPTQAVDVGARADLWRLIQDAAAHGTAVVIASSDLEELAHLCERVIVLKEGTLGIELNGASGLSEDDISHALHDLEAA